MQKCSSMLYAKNSEIFSSIKFKWFAFNQKILMLKGQNKRALIFNLYGKNFFYCSLKIKIQLFIGFGKKTEWKNQEMLMIKIMLNTILRFLL